MNNSNNSGNNRTRRNRQIITGIIIYSIVMLAIFGKQYYEANGWMGIIKFCLVQTVLIVMLLFALRLKAKTKR